MSKQRKSKRIRVRTTSLELDFTKGFPGYSSNHTLELELHGSHRGHMVKVKARLDLSDVPQIAKDLHEYIASEQRKVTLARQALEGPSRNGEQAKP